MKILAWTTTPWTLPSNLALAVGPDIDYAVVEEDGIALRARRRARVERYAKRARRRPRVVGDAQGRRPRRAHLPAAVPLLRRPPPTRSGSSPPTSSTTDEGTGVVHMAPGFGEDDQRVCEANGIAAGRARSTTQGRFTAEVPDYAGDERLRRQPPDHPPTSRTQGVVVRHDTYDHNYPHCWRTDTPIIYRAVSSLVRRGHRVPRPACVELNQQINWIPDHVRDGAVRQVARGRPRLVDHPQPLLGLADPGVAQRRPRLPARSTSTARIDELEADFGVRSTDLHRPFIDDLVRPNPDDPTGQSMMRRVPEVLDCWFESGSMPFAQVALPVREPGVVRRPLPGRLHRRVHRPDPRLVLHAARAVGGAVRPARVPQLHLPRRRARRATAASCPSGCATTPTPTRCSRRIGSRRAALVPAWPRRSCGAATCASTATARASATSCASCSTRSGTPTHFFTLYANADGYRAAVAHRLAPTLLDRYILAKTRELVDDVHRAHGRLRHRRRVRRGHRVPRRAEQLVHPPHPRPLLGAGRRRSGPAQDNATPTTRCYTVLHTLARVAAPLLPFVSRGDLPRA